MHILLYILFVPMILLGLFSIWLNISISFPKEKFYSKKYKSKCWGKQYTNKKYPCINNILYAELYNKYVKKE